MLRRSQNAHYKDSEVVQQKHLPSELTLPSKLHMLNWLLYKVNEMSHTFPSLDPALPAPSSSIFWSATYHLSFSKIHKKRYTVTLLL